MPNKKIKWGLIGASNVAKVWMISAIRSVPDNEVSAVMSSNVEHGKKFAEENNIPHFYNSLEELLANPEIDAVYISTLNHLHKSQTIAAAAAKKHVLCEKPLALSVEDAREMVAACDKAKVVLGTNHHLRNAATHQKIRELIQSGAIGTPFAVRVNHAVYLPKNLQGWRINNKSAGGGAILDITVHDVDLLRFILDAEPTSVIAMSQQTNMAEGELEDGVMSIIKFSNGVIAQLHDAFTAPNAEKGIEIIGTTGSIRGIDVMSQAAIGQIILNNANGTQEIPVNHKNLYVTALTAFDAAIRGSGKPAVTGEDGVKSLETAIAVTNSAKTGQLVLMNNLNNKFTENESAPSPTLFNNLNKKNIASTDLNTICKKI